MKIARTFITILTLMATFCGCEYGEVPTENVEVKFKPLEKTAQIEAQKLVPAKKVEVIPFVEIEPASVRLS